MHLCACALAIDECVWVDTRSRFELSMARVSHCLRYLFRLPRSFTPNRFRVFSVNFQWKSIVIVGINATQIYLRIFSFVNGYVLKKWIDDIRTKDFLLFHLVDQMVRMNLTTLFYYCCILSKENGTNTSKKNKNKFIHLFDRTKWVALYNFSRD